jgi:outer membrane lipoprotein carrier protein
MRAAAAAALAVLACANTGVGAITAEEATRRVQERFDATADFTAAVDQELVAVSAGKTIKANGTVAFKRPGKMRWRLSNGGEQIIVADGTTLWFYQPDERQVLRAPFQAAFRSSTPISFLTGVGRLKDDFEVTVAGEDGGAIQLALRPRRGEGELGKLRLTVDPQSYDIVGAEITDPVGNITRLRFSDLRRNTDLEDAQFHFEVPAGVDVIEAPIGN